MAGSRFAGARSDENGDWVAQDGHRVRTSTPTITGGETKPGRAPCLAHPAARASSMPVSLEPSDDRCDWLLTGLPFDARTPQTPADPGRSPGHLVPADSATDCRL